MLSMILSRPGKETMSLCMTLPRMMASGIRSGSWMTAIRSRSAAGDLMPASFGYLLNAVENATVPGNIGATFPRYDRLGSIVVPPWRYGDRLQ